MLAATYARPGLVCADHLIDVPLDHADPAGHTIELFARVVNAPGRERDDRPTLLYLQGGPGGKADRPTAGNVWLDRALQEFQVVLMDQRGTGRSSPATRQTLAGMSPAEQADHLSHFRADSIVADAELLRAELLGDRPWSVLGQSFGGFCAVTYLSRAPAGLREVLIAGGLPGLGVDADAVYRAAYPRVRAKNRMYFARYPGDRDVLARVFAHVRDHDVRMPTGERLTPQRLQTVGIQLGSGTNLDSLHYLLEEALVAGPAGPTLSDTFLRGVDAIVSLAEHPLFAVLHEPIYGYAGATRWAAHRVREEFGEFDPAAPLPLLTGEMIYPWMFDEDPALVDLREVAHRLAAKDDWPALYDLPQLQRNTVPVAAAVYHDDMYVDREHSLETASAVHGVRTWVTNEHEHDGLRASGNVIDRLLGMVRGRC
ncbi:MAG TPA: alpha/beta fold hydrolase [Nocardioidaceae bacterium]|nr:alpha/beta fold hydrolase [Nocardioidaceae bacterium]